MKDFIMTIPNAASSIYCEKVMRRFDYFKETRSIGRGKIWSRQEQEDNINRIKKDDETYFLGGDGGDHLPLYPDDEVLFSADSFLIDELTKNIWECYDQYAEEYSILPTLSKHYVSPSIRVQKTMPGGGYHMWHCDNGNMHTSRRIIVVSLFLNTVEEGGETEFLYQQKRVSAVQGSMILFPSAWTHVHRGNPPLSGNKYIATTWLELHL